MPNELASSTYAAARLYYEDQRSQQEVADELGVSRSTVSRMLQVARETGIVRIEVRPPTADFELAAELALALGLRHATVVPAARPGGGLSGLVGPALDEIARLRLAPGDVLAVASGKTLWEVVSAARQPRLDGVRIVPALGGMDEADSRFQSNEIARRLAQGTGAEVRLLHAPALPSAALRRSLLKDPDTAARLANWEELSAVLVGIGPAPATRTEGPQHVLERRAELDGAVGEVVTRHYRLDGTPVALKGEERLLAVAREQLHGAGTVIAVAAGEAKAPGIVGAARAGLVDVVVTDAPAAAAAVALARGEPTA